jgi:DNA-binding Xre family transcriptional regulator
MATGTKPAPGTLTQEIAATLRAQIARAKVSQADISRTVGISTGQLSGILNGHKQVDLEQLDELCWALGLSFRQVIADADAATAFRRTCPDWETEPLLR